MLEAWLQQASTQSREQGTELSQKGSMRFHRFVGLSLKDVPPCHSTICRFRNPLDMDVAGADLCHINEAVSPDDLVRRDERTIDVHEADARRPAADGSTRWL
jgi:transposase